MSRSADLRASYWTIIEPADIGPIVTLRERFDALVRERADSTSGDTRRRVTQCSPATLNEIYSRASYQLSDHIVPIIRALEPAVRSVCGDRIFYQRRPYLRVNLPKYEHTVTPFHSDVYFGHSPHAWVLWTPMHDVEGDSGLCLFTPEQSREIRETYDFARPFSDVMAALEKPKPLKLRFGQVLMFSNSLIHGAVAHTEKLPRISFEMRVQDVALPLFEKNFELYSYMAFQ